MSGDSGTKRNLWIITGLASAPFAVLAFLDPVKVMFPHVYYLFGLAIVFNGLVVPFILFRDEPNWLQKTVALGGNIGFASFWIIYTGGIRSIFYPNFFLLPIFAAALYCGFLDAVLTAFFSSVICLDYLYLSKGYAGAVFTDSSLLVNIVFFFLVATIVGYIIKLLREQQMATAKITHELETAYYQLSSSHEQLQSYTGIIEKMNKEIEQLAVTDELTMLYNYRYFQIILDRELKRNKTEFLSLMMVDIDHFKQFNDAYGHITGNRLLAEIAREIKAMVADKGVVFRYGGEEFAIVFPGLRSGEVAEIAENIRRTVKETPVKTAGGKPVTVSVSAGIAAYPVDSKNKSELISHADLALYDAKQSGRNRVCVYRKMM